MEQHITLTTWDGYTVYGTLTTVTDRSGFLIVFVHGLSGNQHEHQYFNAVSYFNNNGFDVLRFDFYPRVHNARPLRESSITTHVQDLETIVNHFASLYKKIILVGHSMWALVALKADMSHISSLIIWDPATPLHTIEEKNGIFDKPMDKYIFQWGIDIIISKEMVEEWRTIDIASLIDAIPLPCAFIFAWDLKKYHDWKSLLDASPKKYPVTIIDHSSHRFVEKGALQKLFEATLSYLQ